MSTSTKGVRIIFHSNLHININSEKQERGNLKAQHETVKSLQWIIARRQTRERKEYKTKISQ